MKNPEIQFRRIPQFGLFVPNSDSSRDDACKAQMGYEVRGSIIEFIDLTLMVNNDFELRISLTEDVKSFFKNTDLDESIFRYTDYMNRLSVKRNSGHYGVIKEILIKLYVHEIIDEQVYSDFLGFFTLISGVASPNNFKNITPLLLMARPLMASFLYTTAFYSFCTTCVLNEDSEYFSANLLELSKMMALMGLMMFNKTAFSNEDKESSITTISKLDKDNQIPIAQLSEGDHSEFAADLLEKNKYFFKLIRKSNSPVFSAYGNQLPEEIYNSYHSKAIVCYSPPVPILSIIKEKLANEEHIEETKKDYEHIPRW